MDDHPFKTSKTSRNCDGPVHVGDQSLSIDLIFMCFLDSIICLGLFRLIYLFGFVLRVYH